MNAKSFDMIAKLCETLERLYEVTDSDLTESGNNFDACSKGGTLIGELSITSQQAITKAFMNERRAMLLSQDTDASTKIERESELAQLLAEATFLRRLPEFEIGTRFADMINTHAFQIGPGFEIRSYAPAQRQNPHGAGSPGSQALLTN